MCFVLFSPLSLSPWLVLSAGADLASDSSTVPSEMLIDNLVCQHQPFPSLCLMFIFHISFFSLFSLFLSLFYSSTFFSLIDLRGQRPVIFASTEKRRIQKCQAHTIKHNLSSRFVFCSSERNLFPAPLSVLSADKSCNFSCFFKASFHSSLSICSNVQSADQRFQRKQLCQILPDTFHSQKFGIIFIIFLFIWAYMPGLHPTHCFIFS